MAIQLNAFPFDSQIIGYGADGLPEYDRASNSLELATLIRSFWRNGVFGTGALTVMAGDGMTVTVSTGSVLVQGRVAHIVSQKTLAIDGASSNPRFDRVVVRCDLSNAVRDLVLDVKKGNPAVSPVAPALTRNESVWEICLATIRITEGATSVSQSMITDTRTNSNLCGIVAATMTEVDTDRFYAQVQSDLESFRTGEQTTMSTFFAERRREFDAWFADVKNILNDSAATKLTAQLMEKASVNSEIVSISPSRWTGADGKYSQRVSCSIAKNEESNVYVVSPVPTSIDEYSDCGIYASEYGDSYIVFSAKDKPDNTLMANVIQIEKGWSSGATINSFAPPVEETVSGSVAHTEIAAARPAVEVISYIEPVQAGSGDAAIDNVRPISGWNKVGVAVTGRNLFDGGDRTVTSGVWRYYLPVPLPAGTYTIGALVTSNDTDNDVCAAAFADKNGTNMVYANLDRDAYNSKTVTIPRPCHSIRFMASNNSSASTGDTAAWSDIQIVPGDVSQDFEPYRGETVTAELPETIYGGNADIVNGTGEKTMGFHELTGDENISISASETLGDGVIIKGILPSVGNVEGLCSHAITSPYLSTKNAMTLGRSNSSWIYWLGILDTLGLSTVDEFKDWLAAQKTAGTPVQIVYQIAQPAPFQMGSQTISTQKGVSNVWSSTGGTDLTYVADTKLYIDRNLAAIAAAALNN